jgi:hypothetical protein
MGPRNLDYFAELAAAGQFGVPVARTFPLDEWRAAMGLSLSGCCPAANSSCSPQRADGGPSSHQGGVVEDDRGDGHTIALAAPTLGSGVG